MKPEREERRYGRLRVRGCWPARCILLAAIIAAVSTNIGARAQAQAQVAAIYTPSGTVKSAVAGGGAHCATTGASLAGEASFPGLFSTKTFVIVVNQGSGSPAIAYSIPSFNGFPDSGTLSYALPSNTASQAGTFNLTLQDQAAASFSAIMVTNTGSQGRRSQGHGATTYDMSFANGLPPNLKKPLLH